jgi:ABC-2 type transport system permease protein
VKARAGSALWLLKHEIRMFFFNASFASKKKAARRGIGKRGAALWIGMFAVIHVLAFMLLREIGGAGLAPPHALVMGVSGLFAAAFSLMMSSGLRASVEVLFERGDLDLLLSSPLSSRGIFSVRLAGIVVGIASIYLFFLTPFANAGLILGQYRLLGIYPVVIGAAAIAASLSMLFTLGLVRLLGVRRTRVVAQVIGALSGALFFLLSQAYGNAAGNARQQVAHWFAPMLAPGAALGPDSIVWLPGQAVLGTPGPLLALSLIALAIFALTVRSTHRFFVHGVQQAVSLVRVAKAPAGGPRYRFGRSLAQVVIVKEWRLIARDPQLISQVLLQLLYMLPLGVLLLTKGGDRLPGTGAALTFLCGSLTASLAWVIISAEDAPDLLRAAPCGMRTIRRAKLIAVAIPAPALMALPLLWILTRNPIAALVLCATVAGSVTTSALITMWCGRPATRGDFKARGKGNFLGSTLEVLNGCTWSGLAYLLLMMSTAEHPSYWPLLGASGLVAIAGAIALFGWLSRSRDD